MALYCPDCRKKTEVANDPAQGSSCCAECGYVHEENQISAEVQFIEGGDGASRMVGNFLSADRAGLRTMGVRNRRLNVGQSREETIANARTRIQQVAVALKGLNEYHIDRAVQCYKLALMSNFTQGRKQNHVVAACLYTICRQEKTTHMLIDFSDVLRVNVYTLGSTFLKLIKALNIDNLPLIDPSLYMARFTAQLNLDGEEISQANTHKVTNDALKVLQRMKRDWIHFGRRPSGLCGAALLLACHMNGFKKTTTDIVKVVKICDQTLKKRLVEFMHTSNGELSVEQFKAQPAELAGDGDNPPCFKQQQLYRKFISYDKDEEEDSEKAQNVEAEMKKSLADIKAQNQALDPLTPPASSVPASTIDLNTDSQTIYPTWEFVEVKEDLDEWSDMSDIDDEIEELLLDEDERKVKEQVWYELNRDWVELQELKAKNLAEKDANENGATKPRRKRKAETDADFSQPVPSMKKSITGTTASEVTKEVVSMKVNSTFSKKILYHNLDHLF